MAIVVMAIVVATLRRVMGQTDGAATPWPESAHNLSRTGGCQRGAVRYELLAPPLKIYICHCAECRKQSASAFGISLIVRAKSFALTRGSPQRWCRPTDSGRTLDCYFCANCGSRVWHGDATREETISVKGGSLDDATDVSLAAHIWTSRKLHGVIIPEHAERHAREPAVG
ncbi:MAG: GFA family protein [Hyphomicrobiaceae bacterium]|nr:GFA family protein [Hyphomicrobiaceae bacterium]